MFVLPLKSKPPYIFLYTVNVFYILCGWIRIIEPEIGVSAILFRKPEVEANRGGMSNMEIAIWLRWKTRDDG